MRFRALAVAITVCFAGSLHAGTQPIVTSDLLKIRSISDLDITRAGDLAVAAVKSVATIPPAASSSGPRARPTYRNQSHLFMFDLGKAGESARQITFGDRHDASPVFSPDGTMIAFVREGPTSPDEAHPHRSAPSRPQVWVISVQGGEARQATDFPYGAERPIWSPDGRRLIFSSSIPMDLIAGQPAWPTERSRRQWNDTTPADAALGPDGSREQIRNWLDLNASEANPVVSTRLDFQDEQRLREVQSFEHLFAIPIEVLGERPLKPGDARQITSGFADHQQAACMPDGQSVVYVAKKPDDQHPDRVLATALWRVGIDGSNDRRILALDGWSLSSPKPSRDGNYLAFLGRQMDEPAYRQVQVGIAAIKSDTASDPAWLTEETTFATTVDDIQWLHAQPALAFTSETRGARPLFTVNPGLIEPARLVQDDADLGPPWVGSFAIGAGSIVYSASSVANPCVLRVRDAQGDRLLWDLNPWLADKALATATEGWVTRPDGVKVQYWLMEPTNRDAAMKYPLAVEMHGGPMAMWGPGEPSMWHEFQLLCSWGYGVVYCNPRGSSGYGYTFQRGTFQDWGEGPGGDVLACVDQALLKEWIDPQRLVLTGGSYAGFLTTWIIAHDNRFKAAVAQRGVYDLATFFGEGKAWRLVEQTMGGLPFDARYRQIIDRNSPFNDVSRIRTPLLIKHGSDDLRTGVSQSEMLYRALKALGRPVEYVRYPGAGHDMSRSGEPLQRMDRLNRIIEFFERHIENPRPAPGA